MIVIILLLNYVQEQIKRFIKRHKIVRYQNINFNTTRSRLNLLEISLKFDLVLLHFSTILLLYFFICSNDYINFNVVSFILNRLIINFQSMLNHLHIVD